MNRRSFLGLLGGAAAGLALAGCGPATGQTGELLVSKARLPKPFRVPLPIPPVAKPVGDTYEITQREAMAEILPGLRTPILGYDGIFPGPTIESRRGRPIVVRHHNELSVPTAVHLHGGHTPHEHDGWPLDLVLPKGGWDAPSHGMTGDVRQGSRDYHYPLNQRAATLWYHDHRMDFTGPAVYRGLAGFHLVRDDAEDALPLPRGDRELPLMICDRSFNEDGTFAYPALDEAMHSVPGVRDEWMEGVLGDVVLVNGAPWPVHEVDAARYRLRLLNASNARRYRVALSPGLPLVQIGSDGGLLSEPVSHDAIEIAPGERFDVIVDFSAVSVGTEVTMVNGLGTGDTANIMRFVVRRQTSDDSRIPAKLAEVEPLTVPRGARMRTFSFTRGSVGDGHKGWTINGKKFAPGESQADSPLGEVEIWRLVTDVHHPVHVHLDQFQVVRRDGRTTVPDVRSASSAKSGDYDLGWKDTVDIRPAEVVDIAVRFTDYPGDYVMHCHNLEHEDMAMMATVRTV